MAPQRNPQSYRDRTNYPSEAQALSSVIETQRKAIETAELEGRISNWSKAAARRRDGCSRPLHRRVAKLEAVSRPPSRIVFEYVYERPELTSKRFIKREVVGNVEFEFWEGPGAACEPLVLPG